jgi:hypothetical protein
MPGHRLISVLALLILPSLAHARVDARFLTTKGDTLEGVFLFMRGDTIYAQIQEGWGEIRTQATHKSSVHAVLFWNGKELDLSKSEFGPAEEVEAEAVESLKAASSVANKIRIENTSRADAESRDSITNPSATDPVADSRQEIAGTEPDTSEAESTAMSPPGEDPVADAEANDSIEYPEPVAEPGAEPGAEEEIAPEPSAESAEPVMKEGDSPEEKADAVEKAEVEKDVEPGVADEKEAKGEESIDSAVTEVAQADEDVAEPVEETAEQAAQEEPTHGMLQVRSTPPGATVYLDDRQLEGSTPLVVDSLPAGRYIIRAIKDTLTGAAGIAVVAGQENPVEIALGSPRTELEISSSPPGVDVYVGKKRSRRKPPDGITPTVLTELPADSVRLYLYKKGYRDTTVSVSLVSGLTNAYSVSLTDLESLQKTASGGLRRPHQKTAVSMVLPSIVSVMVGGAFMVAAGRDYEEASSVKDYLEGSLVGGPSYDAAVQENEERVRTGNVRMGVGSVLVGLGAVGLSAGLVLYF